MDASGRRSAGRGCRVITFSLADEPTARYDGSAEGFDRYVDQIARALDGAGLQRAAICGVSFGGLIAAAFAARHPERVSSLVLVSALPPSWKLNERASFYLRAPRLLRRSSVSRRCGSIARSPPRSRGFWNGVSGGARPLRQRGRPTHSTPAGWRGAPYDHGAWTGPG